MKRLLLIIALLTEIIMVSSAQQASKISPSTHIIIADRDGKLSLDAAKKEMIQMKKNKRNAPWKVSSTTETTTEDEDDGDGFPFATPTNVNGVKVVQCWIGMTDDNYAALEALGVKIQAKFDGKVTANVPVDALEKVAELANVTKVSVSNKLKKNTYRSRILTNVDDVLNYSTDAQTAGLLQTYDGTGVVLGVVDVGIDFGHEMFSNRIKKKYVYNTTAGEMQEYTGSTVYYTDDPHGTLTSSIAGGSDFTARAYVYTTSSSYTTVSNAKFGGMAPGTDLVLCDLGDGTNETNIATCIKNISDYADEVGKPCVISISLGGHYGPHDGTGYLADVCAQYTGTGKIIIFSAGNEGGNATYHYKNATASSPAQTILTSNTRSDYGFDYGIAYTYARTPNVELAARYYVVNTSTNTILWSSNEITTDDYILDDKGNIKLYGAQISVNDTGSDGTTKLSTYFTAYNNDSINYGYLCCYLDKDTNNEKWYVDTRLWYLKAVDNKYEIGLSIYPKTGTSLVESWDVGGYLTFTSSSATANSTSFTEGSDVASISNQATFLSVISVGAYCSSIYWCGGTTTASNYHINPQQTYLDIFSFSSYQLEGNGPLGSKLPWITAPGFAIIAAFNSGYNPESNGVYAYGTNKKLGVWNTGTSMAAPCVAGITALWLQVKPTLTPEEVKEIMAETAIKDSYVTGTNANKFGQGKIDALAGIKYILENENKPRIGANPINLDFIAKTNETVTKTVNVMGRNLTDNITVMLNDSNGVFSIDKTSITDSAAINGDAITITYTPIVEDTYTATITLSSTGADNVVITINGTVEEPIHIADVDLAALRKFYADFLGTEWNGTPWDITSEIIKDGNWSGVTFNADGQVTDINLQSRGLSGTLSTETAPNLPMLKSLNMSHNTVEGDATTFIEALPALTSLNLSYNRLCELSEPLPATVTQVNLGYQNMDRSISLSELFENVGDLTSLLPNISTYNASGRTFNFNGYFYLTNESESGNQSWRINQSNGTLKQVANPTVIYNENNGKEVKMRIYNGSQWNDMRLVIDYGQGDVNLDWLRDVSDLQHLINFCVNDNHVAVFFNFQAGDLQPDEAINVLDLVRLINLLLADNGTNGQQVRKRKVSSLDDETEAKLVIRDNELVLITEKPVAALDIVLEHNAGIQVEWLSAQYGWQVSKQATGSISHGIIYSMTHKEFPVGETVIARINSGDAAIRKAMAADADAQEITLGYQQVVTGIHEMTDGETQDETYTIGGIKVKEKPRQKDLYIVNGKKQIIRKH